MSKRPLAAPLGLALLALLPSCMHTPMPPPPSVGAAVATPSPVDAADGIVMLHTRLMVAGLGCGSVWQDPGAFGHYASFVSRNAAAIRAAQQAKAARLGGMAAFDSEHTILSNRESMRMRQMGAQAYCTEMKAPFYAAMAAPAAKLPTLAQGL